MMPLQVPVAAGFTALPGAPAAVPALETPPVSAGGSLEVQTGRGGQRRMHGFESGQTCAGNGAWSRGARRSYTWGATHLIHAGCDDMVLSA